MIAVPRLAVDARRALAPSTATSARSAYAFDPPGEKLPGRPRSASIILVSGIRWPDAADGDEILVDRGDGRSLRAASTCCGSTTPAGEARDAQSRGADGLGAHRQSAYPAGQLRSGAVDIVGGWSGPDGGSVVANQIP